MCMVCAIRSSRSDCLRGVLSKPRHYHVTQCVDSMQYANVVVCLLCSLLLYNKKYKKNNKIENIKTMRKDPVPIFHTYVTSRTGMESTVTYIHTMLRTPNGIT